MNSSALGAEVSRERVSATGIPFPGLPFIPQL